VGTKENKNNEIKLRLSNNLKNKYKKYCINNNLHMSKHIRSLIENCINND